MHVDEPGCTILGSVATQPSNTPTTTDAQPTPHSHDTAEGASEGSTQQLEISSEAQQSTSSSNSDSSSGQGGEANASIEGVGATSGGVHDERGLRDEARPDSSGSSSSHEDAATLSLYSELVPPSIAKMIEREGGVEEWLVEMQVCVCVWLVKVPGVWRPAEYLQFRYCANLNTARWP